MNERMTQTAGYYLEGDTKGNLTASMKKAGYSDNYAEHKCDRMGRDREFLSALAQRRAEMQAGAGERVEIVHQQFQDLLKDCVLKKDRTNAARCIENMAKNAGYYALDNKQQAEQRALTEAEVLEAHRLANIRLLEGVG